MDGLLSLELLYLNLIFYFGSHTSAHLLPPLNLKARIPFKKWAGESIPWQTFAARASAYTVPLAKCVNDKTIVVIDAGTKMFIARYIYKITSANGGRLLTPRNHGPWWWRIYNPVWVGRPEGDPWRPDVLSSTTPSLSCRCLHRALYANRVCAA